MSAYEADIEVAEIEAAVEGVDWNYEVDLDLTSRQNLDMALAGFNPTPCGGAWATN